MTKKPICGGGKYELAGQTGETIGLPVVLKGLPPKIQVEGYTLFLKSSFHISLVCIGKIIEKHGVSISSFIDKVVDDFCEFIKTNEVSLVGYRDEFRFVSDKERRSVVVMCDISNLDKFFELLNQKYGLQFEMQPTHVTLYTLQPDLGIFLTDSQDIERLTKLISNPGLVLT